MEDAIATAREAFRAYEVELRRLRERNAVLEAENARQRSFLLEYGRHREGCGAERPGGACGCEWAAVIGSRITVGVTPANGT